MGEKWREAEWKLRLTHSWVIGAKRLSKDTDVMQKSEENTVGEQVYTCVCVCEKNTS